MTSDSNILRKLLRTTIRLILLAGISAAFSACGLFGRASDEQRRGRLYETVWVDPVIVLSDTLVTLIRSERIDSIIVDPSQPPVSKPASVEIDVFEPLCNVSVNLLGPDLKLIRPLLVRNLSGGFYRLTFNPARLGDPELYSGSYFLQADYCGNLVVSGFTVD